ncbi:MAG: chlorophyll a-b binding domain-containing protein, partial [Pseudomonadota bacterium]
GFDPLGLASLGSDQTLAWFRAAELKHGRVAMLATTGYLVQAAGIHFPGMLSSLVKEARREWWFHEDNNAHSIIHWRYEFVSRTVIHKAIVWLVTQLWKGYMRKALAQCKTQVEAISAD